MLSWRPSHEQTLQNMAKIGGRSKNKCKGWFSSVDYYRLIRKLHFNSRQFDSSWAVAICQGSGNKRYVCLYLGRLFSRYCPCLIGTSEAATSCLIVLTSIPKSINRGITSWLCTVHLHRTFIIKDLDIIKIHNVLSILNKSVEIVGSYQRADSRYFNNYLLLIMIRFYETVFKLR